MKEKEISKVYAQALRSIGKESNIDVTNELVKFNSALNTSNELEQIMFLDAFSDGEKLGVFESLSSKLNLNNTVSNFIKYLINEKRISLINQIYKEVVVIEDEEKGFLNGTVEGFGNSIDDSTKQKLISHLEKKLNKKINLEYKKNEKITAGYRVAVGDYLMDATLDNQFEEFKKTIMF